jgi:hypothetical protein
MKEYFPNEPDFILLELFCSQQTLRGIGVSTEAIVISCFIDRAPMMKEIISSSDFPCSLAIIPYGYTQVCGPKSEIKWMKINNDYSNKVQGIGVDGFSNDFLNSPVQMDNDTYPTVSSLILRNPAIISIERTKLTDVIGKYLLIVYRDLYQSAQEHLSNICKDIFPNVYSTPTLVSDYKLAYTSVPRVTALA